MSQRQLYLIGDEYHDDYQSHYTFTGTVEELEEELEKAEYYFRGYAWYSDLQGPCMPDTALITVKGGGDFKQPTMADMWPKPKEWVRFGGAAYGL